MAFKLESNLSRHLNKLHLKLYSPSDHRLHVCTQGRIGIYDTNKEERPLSAQLGLAAPASAPPVMEHFNSFLEVPILAARTIGGKYATISEESQNIPLVDRGLVQPDENLQNHAICTKLSS